MSLFSMIGSYEDAWKAIVMPPRTEYSIHDLGPTEFIVGDNRIKRTDLRILNKRGEVLECSFYQHANTEQPMPCVIYLHANACCRLEALNYVDLILSNRMSFFSFDFSGCGKSGGTYTSIGWFEQDDLECVIQYLCNTGRVTKIGVWGRSMGAVTSLMYSGKDSRISCLILDSPFSKFKQLVKELAKEKMSIPGFITEAVFAILKSTIKNKVKFDLDALRPLDYVEKVKIPALFGAAKEDTFVLPHHTRELYMKYGGQKQLMMFEGDHNCQRPANWMMLTKEFLKVQLLGAKGHHQNNSQQFKQQQLTQREETFDRRVFEQQKPESLKDSFAVLRKRHSEVEPAWYENRSSLSSILNKTHSTQILGVSERSVGDFTLEYLDKNPQYAKDKGLSKRLNELFVSDKKKKSLSEPQGGTNQNQQMDLAKKVLELQNQLKPEHKPSSLKFTSFENSHSIEKELKENVCIKKQSQTAQDTKRMMHSNSISIFGPKRSQFNCEDMNILGDTSDLSELKNEKKALKEIPQLQLSHASSATSSQQNSLKDQGNLTKRSISDFAAYMGKGTSKNVLSTQTQLTTLATHRTQTKQTLTTEPGDFTARTFRQNTILTTRENNNIKENMSPKITKSRHIMKTRIDLSEYSINSLNNSSSFSRKENQFGDNTLKKSDMVKNSETNHKIPMTSYSQDFSRGGFSGNFEFSRRNILAEERTPTFMNNSQFGKKYSFEYMKDRFENDLQKIKAPAN